MARRTKFSHFFEARLDNCCVCGTSIPRVLAGPPGPNKNNCSEVPLVERIRRGPPLHSCESPYLENGERIAEDLGSVGLLSVVHIRALTLGSSLLSVLPMFTTG